MPRRSPVPAARRPALARRPSASPRSRSSGGYSPWARSTSSPAAAATSRRSPRAPRAVPRRGCRRRGQPHLDRQEPLLCAVVEVPLEPEPLTLGGGHDAGARLSQVVHQLGVVQQHRRGGPDPGRDVQVLDAASWITAATGIPARLTVVTATDPCPTGELDRSAVHVDVARAARGGDEEGELRVAEQLPQEQLSLTGVAASPPRLATSWPRLVAANTRPRTCPSSIATGTAIAAAAPKMRTGSASSEPAPRSSVYAA